MTKIGDSNKAIVNKAIGNTIKFFRIKKCYSLHGLSIDSGYSYQKIIRIESGKTGLKVIELLILISDLNTSTQKFFNQLKKEIHKERSK